MTEIGGKKISELEEKTTLAGTEFIVVVDDTGATGPAGAAGAKGDKGDTGATGAAGRGVKSIALTKDANGAITGGTVTYTDGKSEAITITTATA